MKTLQQIEKHGDMQRYMEDLGTATQSILPSRDGSPESPCHFIVIVTDDNGLTNYVTDLSDEESVSLLHDTVCQIVGKASQEKTFHKPSQESGSKPEEPK